MKLTDDEILAIKERGDTLSGAEWDALCDMALAANAAKRQKPGAGLAEISLKYSRLASGTLSVFPAKMEMHTDGSTHNADITVLFQQAIAEALRAPQAAPQDKPSAARICNLETDEIKAAYHARFRDGWLWEQGSWFIEGYKAGKQAAPSSPAARGWAIKGPKGEWVQVNTTNDQRHAIRMFIQEEEKVWDLYYLPKGYTCVPVTIVEDKR